MGYRTDFCESVPQKCENGILYQGKKVSVAHFFSVPRYRFGKSVPGTDLGTDLLSLPGTQFYTDFYGSNSGEE